MIWGRFLGKTGGKKSRATVLKSGTKLKQRQNILKDILLQVVRGIVLE
jgi:hypothetical protein